MHVSEGGARCMSLQEQERGGMELHSYAQTFSMMHGHGSGMPHGFRRLCHDDEIRLCCWDYLS